MAFEWKLFSRKQLDFIANSDARVNIAHGAVRSGKTIASLVRWIDFLGTSPHKEFLMSGKTRDSLYTNILRPLFEMTEGIPHHYDPIKGILEIFGKIIWLKGFKDESITAKLKGMTVGGWYADEADEYPQSAVMVAYERCSLPGSKIFLTMNPNTPYHYIYIDYITNEEALSSGRVKVWHFLLEDNLALDKSYIEDLKKNHKGVFYQRNILGEWCIAEGAIYDVYIPNEHDYNNGKEDYAKEYDEVRIGIDYGTASGTCFSMIGVKNISDGKEKVPHYYLLKEMYYDAREIGIKKTDTDFVKDMKRFIGIIPYSTINVPHDAQSFLTELQRKGFRCNMVKGDVYEGIQYIRALFTDTRLFIHEDCSQTKAQLQTYVWDPKALTKGKEVPLKVNDHAVDALRYAINTIEKKVPIVGTVGYW